MTNEVNKHEHHDDGLTAKIASLTILQGIISRMASNSLAMKTWAITVVAGFVAIKSSLGSLGGLTTLVPILVCLAFSFLDAYYLSQERIFRSVYNSLSSDKVGCGSNYLDFSNNVKEAAKLSDNKPKACYTSPSVMYFYVPLAFIAVIIMVKG
ncbi:hypothetical protein ROK90_21740 [Cronobacter dublinensis]|uniref:hypothetical protein n=1 Tax=Cronobacter dublinensis TaxID=413497 RepID=UPI0028942750|nr:hypothetical protein [Cronobacter dublinensis]MDT3668600.1 hypothetical protein [Cronobacter dublinensis]